MTEALRPDAPPGESLARVLRYVQMRSVKPLGSRSDAIHSIHTGTDWAAELRLSDVQAVAHAASVVSDSACKRKGEIMEPYSEPMSRLESVISALRGLYEQVLSLDDYTLTRDLPQHEAQAVFDDAVGTAGNVLNFTERDSHNHPQRDTEQELRAALQLVLDSEQEGYTDEDEPSWITGARKVLAGTQISAPPNRSVVCAAIRDEHGVIICGPRHFDGIMHAQLAAYPKGSWKMAEQGFVDQRGVFLNRKQALGVAEEAGQIIRRVGGDDNELFSENLY